MSDLISPYGAIFFHSSADDPAARHKSAQRAGSEFRSAIIQGYFLIRQRDNEERHEEKMKNS